MRVDSPLPQLRVTEPCPIKWESMRGDGRTRFCDQCQLHVHNVSALSGREAARLLAAAPGRVCMNGMARGDGTLVTRESLAEVLRQQGASRWRIAAVRAAAWLGLGTVAASLAACCPIRLGGSVLMPEPCLPRRDCELPPRWIGGDVVIIREPSPPCPPYSPERPAPPPGPRYWTRDW
jgi:hypothetical protein